MDVARALLHSLLVFLHPQPLLLVLLTRFFGIFFLVPFPSKVCISGFGAIRALFVFSHEWGGGKSVVRIRHAPPKSQCNECCYPVALAVYCIFQSNNQTAHKQ